MVTGHNVCHLRLFGLLAVLCLYANAGLQPKDPVIWFGSQEGLSMQIIHLENALRCAHASNRSIAPVPFVNPIHYPDERGLISLCNVFEFPSDIHCLPHSLTKNRDGMLASIRPASCVNAAISDPAN